MRFLAGAVAGAGVDARGLPSFRTELVSVLANGSWNLLGPPALCAGVREERSTSGEQRPNHRSNKKFRRSKLFTGLGKSFVKI